MELLRRHDRPARRHLDLRRPRHDRRRRARRRRPRLPADRADADLFSAQDQNIVVGALLLASVIVPNAARPVPRARARGCAARRRADTRPRSQAAGVSRGRADARRHLRDRPGRLLAAVRGPARAARGLPARDRGAPRGAWAPRSSRPASSTRRRRARRPATTLAAGARRPRAALHRDLRDVLAGAARGAGRSVRRS